MLPERGPEYTHVERTLTDVLRKLNLFAQKNPQVDRSGRRQKIDLVWELKDSIIDQERKGEQFDMGFIQRMDGKFGVEFSEKKNAFIRFVLADTYRGDRDSLFDIWSLKDPEFMAIDELRESALAALKDVRVQDIIDWINFVALQGKKDLDAIKIFGSSGLFFRMQKLWDDYIKQLQELNEKYLLPAKDKNVLAVAKGAFLDDWENLFVDMAANLEMLTKSLNSPNKRVILYVGGDHGNWIGNTLEQKLNFKKVIDIGLITENAEKLAGAHLSASGIKFLLKMPRPNQTKMHKNLSAATIDQLNQLGQLWNNMSKKITEFEFLKKIDAILQNSRQAYVDLMNLQIGDKENSRVAFVRGGLIQDYTLVNPTLLHIAVERGFQKAVEKLLGIPFISLDIQSDQGTPLYIAVRRYTEAFGTEKEVMKTIINLLLNAGANANIPSFDPDFDTALHRAVVNNDIELATLLLENGAEVNTQTLDPDNPTYGGDTPLHMVQSPEMARLLLNYGARIDLSNNQNQTPFKVQVNDEIIKILKEKSGKVG